MNYLGKTVVSKHGRSIYLSAVNINNIMSHYVIIAEEKSPEYKKILLVDNITDYKDINCWKCHKPLNSDTHQTCNICHWLICDDCSACSNHKEEHNEYNSKHLVSILNLNITSLIAKEKFLFLNSKSEYEVNLKFINALQLLLNEDIPFSLQSEHNDLCIFWNIDIIEEPLLTKIIRILISNQLIDKWDLCKYQDIIKKVYPGYPPLNSTVFKKEDYPPLYPIPKNADDLFDFFDDKICPICGTDHSDPDVYCAFLED